MNRKSLTVLDLFCGAGGFSEGFRNAGFKIVGGVDHWRPAVDTFNCNFGLTGKPVDILTLENRPDLIDALPDTDVIIGSPPCVSFSYSNKLGNADKTQGLRLIKIFFSVVAIKRYKLGSHLKAWYMENVANARGFLPKHYTFKDLGLSKWAKEHFYDPSAIAIRIEESAGILNAADFGIPQTRKRLFIHEIIYPLSSTVTETKARSSTVKTLSSVRLQLPPPNTQRGTRKITDPLYKGIKIPLSDITDHFYETGAYEIHWRESRHLKQSHPYMGKMAFPENGDKPSRTIVASPFPRSREALLYSSEWNRKGDGEYRGPTIREAAVLMSFPITYQFIGSEGAKWKLVGNAVCPLVSEALASRLLKALGRPKRRSLRKELPGNVKDFPNLNTFAEKLYSNPPRRQKLARFRSHPFKAASMTVALTNYDLVENKKADGQWRCYVTYGIGNGYRVQSIDVKNIELIRKAVESSAPEAITFVNNVLNGFTTRIPPANVLQTLYEANVSSSGDLLSPYSLLQKTEELVFQFSDRTERVIPPPGLFLRDSVPKSQLYALFAVSQIAAIAEHRREKSNE